MRRPVNVKAFLSFLFFISSFSKLCVYSIQVLLPDYRPAASQVWIREISPMPLRGDSGQMTGNSDVTRLGKDCRQTGSDRSKWR
jgi:hypothetical protein